VNAATSYTNTAVAECGILVIRIRDPALFIAVVIRVMTATGLCFQATLGIAAAVPQRRQSVSATVCVVGRAMPCVKSIPQQFLDSTILFVRDR